VTVGFHSPLPPARTGVADYAASLLRALRKRGRVEVEPPAADVRLYQIGNNTLHAAIYQRALAEPGVVLLHDALLQHLFFGTLDEARYVEEFVYNYGQWHEGLALDLWRSRSGSGMREEFYRYPMLRRLVERSLALVVHNAAAARIVKEHAAAANVAEIPHLFDPPELPSPAEVERYRDRLGLRPSHFTFGLFGYLRESKRVMPLLRAFDRVRRAHPQARLLVAGSFVSQDLERAAGPLLAGEGVQRVGHLAERDFWRAAAAADACVNLRYPSAGETSGISIRLMGLGKPVLVTESEENAGFPDYACMRIDAGAAEEEMLTASMLSLCIQSGLAREIGRHAADHIRSHHAADRIAELFWETLCACCASSSQR
jgi:glycosyltransferase involved in cell wall biosynthesis